MFFQLLVFISIFSIAIAFRKLNTCTGNQTTSDFIDGSWVGGVNPSTTAGQGSTGGDKPAYNPSTDTLYYGYVEGTMSQNYTVTSLITDSTQKLLGFQYYWNYLNQGNALGTISVKVVLRSLTKQILSSTNFTLPRTTGSFTIQSGSVLFAQQYLISNTSTIELSFTGQDSITKNGYWGPQVNAPSLKLTYTSCVTTTSTPSLLPSVTPTMQPSLTPTVTPTITPSIEQTKCPSNIPTTIPTNRPTEIPTVTPTFEPTKIPTNEPTTLPSDNLTEAPSRLPSDAQTNAPFVAPSTAPSVLPSTAPSIVPTAAPSTGSPTSTAPSVLPSAAPSIVPTAAPSTGSPTSTAPSVLPSAAPSIVPTAAPSTGSPTSTAPSVLPSAAPSIAPTAVPSTGSPTSTASSVLPSIAPSKLPSIMPSSCQPSLFPSRSPSVFPSFLPTYTPSVVAVSTLSIGNVFVYNTKVSFTVSLSPVPLYSGYIYCLTSPIGYNITSIPSLIVEGTKSSFLPQQSSVAIDSSVIPLKQYDLYCYLQYDNGVGSSLMEVISTRTSIQTSCCKEIKFTSAPTRLFADTSRYDMKIPALFTYTIALSNSPTENITITPSFIVNNSATNSFTLVPSSLTISAGSKLSVSFIAISSNKYISGEYLLNLTLSGPSSFEFITSFVRVQVIAESEPPPPPKLIVATFGSRGIDFFVGFDSPTSMMGLNYATFLCSSLLNFTGIEYAGSSCSWVNSSYIRGELQLSADLTNQSLPTIENMLTLLPLKLQAQCLPDDTKETCATYTYASKQSVQFSTTFRIIPVVSLVLPPSLGACDDLLINPVLSVGSAGRRWSKVEWQVEQTRADQTGDDSSAIMLSWLSQNSSYADKIVRIPRTLLKNGEYRITLTLTNFLGFSGSRSATVSVNGDSLLPTSSIFTSTPLLTRVNLVAEVAGNGAPSSCSNPLTTTLVYNWQIYTENKLTNIRSISKQPRTLSIPANTLSSGKVYSVVLNVTAIDRNTRVSSTSLSSMMIIVQQGDLIARIAGGQNRQVQYDSSIVLDGSSSYDEDTSENSQLLFNWKCSITSIVFYGMDCTESTKILDQQSPQRLIVSGNLLNSTLEYRFDLLVTSSDGNSRSAGTFVTVTSVDQELPTIIIADVDESIKLDPNEPFSLLGYVQGNNASDVFVQWQITVDGQSIDYSSVTTTSRVLSAAVLKSRYPALLPVSIQFPSGSFKGGLSYYFSLSGSFVNTNATVVSAFTLVTLYTNLPPSNGILLASPEEGMSLTTIFTLTMSNWVDDPSDYPLRYEFRFQASPRQKLQTLTKPNNENEITTFLPPGIESYDYMMYLNGRVYDIYDATATANTTVICNLEKNLDISLILQSQVAIGFANSDDSTISQIINIASTILNIQNCSAASSTYCTSLNRYPCESVPNTCSVCLPGYKGIVGPSNTKCLNESSVTGKVGASCVSDDDCLYGTCDKDICSEPNQTCPTNIPDKVCSGHGVCQYFDLSGKLLSDACSVTTTSCYPSCSCTNGYGGADCHLSPLNRTNFDANRATLCATMIRLNTLIDPTTTLVSSLAASLSTIYNPYEIITDQSNRICLDTLNLIADLSGQGYVSSDAADNLLGMVSSFVVSPTVRSTLSDNEASNAVASQDVTSAITTITNSYLQKMTVGQDPFTYSSDSLQVTLYRSLANDLVDASLSPPATDADQQYGKLGQSVTFEGSSALLCADADDYTQLTVLKWGRSPYSNTSDLESPLLYISSNSNTAATTTTTTTTTTTDDVVYYITLQYHREQELNRNYSIEDARRLPGATLARLNFTFPECSFYDGEQLRDCNGCNISSYTDYNVTYKCSDISVICGSSGSNRRLQSLQKNLQVSLLADDDDGTSNSDQISAAQFSTIFVALAGEIASVLSSNPFDINLEEAKAILAFIGCILLVIFAGGLYFTFWDRYDRKQRVYGKHWPPEKPTWQSIFLSYLPSLKKKNKRSTLTKSTSKKITKMDRESTKLDKFHLDELRYVDCQTSRQSMDTKKAKKLSVNIKRASILRKEESPGIDFATFFDIAMPEAFKGSMIKIMPSLFITKHDFFSMFTEASLMKSRLTRWIQVSKSVLIGIFIDTLFFGIFYQNNGACESYDTKVDCLATMNDVTNSPSCRWMTDSDSSNGGTCELRPPPNNITYTVVLALLCVFVGLPLDMVMTYVLDEYCSKRPDLDQIGLDSARWLGASTKDLFEKDTASDGKHRRQVASLLSKNLNKSVLAAESAALSTSRYAMKQFMTVEEELNDILLHAHTHFQQLRTIYPTLSMEEEADLRTVINARAYELRKELGVLHIIDNDTQGSTAINTQQTLSMKPLTTWEKLKYGSSNPRAKLLAKLSRIRQREVDITDRMESVMFDANMQEMTLLYCFLLEQFTPFKRYVLEHYFLSFDSASPPSIDFWPWFGAWTGVVASMLFFVYWTLAWSVQNGEALLAAWGWNFAVGAMQDIFVVQLMKIYIFYVIAVTTIAPKLKEIRLELTNIAAAYLRKSPDDVKQSIMLYDGNSEDDSKDAGGDSKDALTMRWKLARILDFHVVQHVSPSCRMAHRGSLDTIPARQTSVFSDDLAMTHILRHLNDRDMEHMRKERGLYTAWYSIFLLAIPFLAQYLGSLIIELTLDILLPSCSTAFILANYYLLSVSIYCLVVPYCLLLCYMVYYARVYLAARKKRHRKRLLEKNRREGIAVIEGIKAKHQHQRHGYKYSSNYYLSTALLMVRGLLMSLLRLAVSVKGTIVYVIQRATTAPQRQLDKEHVRTWKMVNNTPQSLDTHIHVHRCLHTYIDGSVEDRAAVLQVPVPEAISSMIRREFKAHSQRVDCSISTTDHDTHSGYLDKLPSSTSNSVYGEQLTVSDRLSDQRIRQLVYRGRLKDSSPDQTLLDNNSNQAMRSQLFSSKLRHSLLSQRLLTIDGDETISICGTAGYKLLELYFLCTLSKQLALHTLPLRQQLETLLLALDDQRHIYRAVLTADDATCLLSLTCSQLHLPASDGNTEDIELHRRQGDTLTLTILEEIQHKFNHWLQHTSDTTLSAGVPLLRLKSWLEETLQTILRDKTVVSISADTAAKTIDSRDIDEETVVNVDLDVDFEVDVEVDVDYNHIYNNNRADDDNYNTNTNTNIQRDSHAIESKE